MDAAICETVRKKLALIVPRALIDCILLRTHLYATREGNRARRSTETRSASASRFEAKHSPAKLRLEKEYPTCVLKLFKRINCTPMNYARSTLD